MSRIRAAVCGLVALGLLAACAGQQAPTAPGTRSTATSLPSVTTVPSPTVPSPTVPSSPNTVPPRSSTTGKPAPEQLTLTGVVEAGVEPNCLLLTDATSGKKFNLTGGAPSIVKPEARVKVVGVIRNDLMSYCQQGTIFQVLKATAE